ncbi:hypothetical protein [Sorangium sp. So ce1182]|uniref:hypothetical protein n=1 Tax=Sorangium sp. So ce1182 TaxID=3133334 RepID=UPI003F5DD17B
MKERERLVVTGIFVVLLVGWLGFLVHRAPRFAGSLAGAIFGIAAAILMVVPLAYSIVKRIRPLRDRLTQHVHLRTLLAWHIYAGILGPLLALVHTGHRFDSPIGVALTAAMLIVVVSGFTGRYLLGYVGRELNEKKAMRASLEVELARARDELAREGVSLAHPWRWALVGSLLAAGGGTAPASLRVVRLAEAVADVEYAIRSHALFKAWFARWLRLHIVLSVVLYALLALHIGTEIYYGLRWLR